MTTDPVATVALTILCLCIIAAIIGEPPDGHQ